MVMATSAQIAKYPTMLLTVKGRKTGKLRTIPLIYIRDADRFVIAAAYAGSEQNPTSSGANGAERSDRTVDRTPLTTVSDRCTRASTAGNTAAIGQVPKTIEPCPLCCPRTCVRPPDHCNSHL